MSTREFYRQQAAEQLVAANAAILQNVRERCERAAKAWESLAAGVEGMERHRAERARETASNDVQSGSPDSQSAAS